MTQGAKKERKMEQAFRKEEEHERKPRDHKFQAMTYRHIKGGDMTHEQRQGRMARGVNHKDRNPKQ